MHLNPNSPLNEWNFNEAEMETITNTLELPLIQAYIKTRLALMFYNYSEQPSMAHPSNGNSIEIQAIVDKAMLQGARTLYNSLYDNPLNQPTEDRTNV